MANGEGWILVEFVGGPMDGTTSKLEATMLAGLVRRMADYSSSYRNYRLTDPPKLSDAAFDHWEERERRSVAAFGDGPPDFYIQMVWQQPNPVPTDIDEPDETPTTHRTRDAGLTVQRNRLTSALVAGDEDLATTIASAFVVNDTSATSLIESLLAPALRRIGEAWANETITILAEHRASCIVHRILTRQIIDPGPVRRGRAVVTTLTGERHGVPTEMAAVALREDGWSVDLLGAETPVEELTSMSALPRIDLIVLSVTLRSGSEAAHIAAESLRHNGFAVLVGGPGKRLSELQDAARASFAY